MHIFKMFITAVCSIFLIKLRCLYDINLFFYDNKWSNCPLSRADVSHEFQIHVSVYILTIKINQ